jgi:hypothetical protein
MLTNLGHRVSGAADAAGHSHYRAAHASLPILPDDLSTHPALYIVRKPPRIQGRQRRYQCGLVRLVSPSCQSAKAAIREEVGGKRYRPGRNNGSLSGEHGGGWANLRSWEEREGR